MRLVLILVLIFFLQFGVNAQCPGYQAPDTFHIDFLGLGSDTIHISGYIADCGEFGGYIDKMEFYWSNDNLIGVLIKNEGNCSLKFSEMFNPYNKRILLDLSKQNIIQKYADDFANLAITPSAESNAPTEFWITVKNRTYHRWDPSGKWRNFCALRDSLFLK